MARGPTRRTCSAGRLTTSGSSPRTHVNADQDDLVSQKRREAELQAGYVLTAFQLTHHRLRFFRPVSHQVYDYGKRGGLPALALLMHYGSQAGIWQAGMQQKPALVFNEGRAARRRAGMQRDRIRDEGAEYIPRHGCPPVGREAEGAGRIHDEVG